jgi:prolyl oligopeptidase
MRFVVVSFVLWLAACSSAKKEIEVSKSTPAVQIPADEYLWLEDIQGEKALAWVKERNAETFKAIASKPLYKKNEAELKKILLAKDRIPAVSQRGKYFYNFWQDDHHVRGLWRRTPIEEYKKKSPRWEIVLDIDQLAKKEKENWVFKGSICLPPEFKHCMITLSRGGKDNSVAREFNTEKKAFVKNGFITPEARNTFGWLDDNTLVLGTNYGPDTLSKSGYPLMLKIWKRGRPLSEATLIYQAPASSMATQVYTWNTPAGNKTVIGNSLNFYEEEDYELTPEYTLKKIEKPLDASLSAWLAGRFILTLKSDWDVRGQTYKAGSLVSLPLFENGQPKLIFAPNEKQSIVSVEQTKDALLISYLDTVQGKIARANLQGDEWKFEPLPFPDKGDLSLNSVDGFGDLIVVGFESFLTPSSLLAAHVGLDKKPEEVKLEILKQLPARFDASNLTVDQNWAISRDGTQVPYFIIHKKDMKLDGKNPTLIYGYGGFEISQNPFYPTVSGKAWMEKGGVYVVANIRGGGEFGPNWHKAALKENRQKAFDDFISVAEDVVKRKISNPNKMAISGGSNGGLLVGAVYVERPDLFRAVICKVPLLDMVRYNKLLAGSSWEAEYGRPEDPQILNAILKYSPYQNLKAEVSYPEVFFMTSTLDDRVHPGHARKMVAKMRAQHHPYLYFENTEGGHSAAANVQQRVRSYALEYTFLQDRLLK